MILMQTGAARMGRTKMASRRKSSQTYFVTEVRDGNGFSVAYSVNFGDRYDPAEYPRGYFSVFMYGEKDAAAKAAALCAKLNETVQAENYASAASSVTTGA